MGQWLKNVEHVNGNSGGSFTGGGNKMLLHMTEGGTRAEDIIPTLRNRNAWVHLVFNPWAHRDVIQCLPFNTGARGLEHPVGTPQTNRADVVQMEIVGFSEEETAVHYKYDKKWAVENWGEPQYRRLAKLLLEVREEFPFPLHVRGFQRPKKFSPQEFIDFRGICGHVHVPNNTHTDPGRHFRGGHLLNLMKELS